MKKNAKSKRADAERACEWYAHEVMGCKRTVRAVRTQWQRQDLFACDVLGKREDGTLVALQVTAGQASHVTERKKKIEKEIWHENDTVQILRLVSTENPGKEAKRLWFFKVFDYKIYKGQMFIHREWLEQDVVSVPREWFTAYKKG